MSQFNNPFSKLAPRGSQSNDSVPAAPVTPPAESVTTAPSAPKAGTPSPIPRAVVRLERAGRGGKEVTVIEHLDLKPADRARWLKDLKAALGCGGVIEDDAIALQGDHRKRLPDILSKRGVKRVTVGT